MTDWDRVQTVLSGASELPREQRAAYLDAACGDDAALRAEVESLLTAYEEAGEFLADPTAGAPPLPFATDVRAPQSASAEPALREHEGQVVGRYKLLERIGEGGFGSVWMAEQREPVKRRVALKIIKLGMDTRQVIARFEAERQALALMEHPNIAKVFDAGSTDLGRPYFVMEYIKGVPILEYCDSAQLDTRARLELFGQVCNAIQHAHQKGVIHRDIKPGNVLVTMHDGVPVPKVIDFGIAKATSAELTNRTIFTQHRQIVGTPAYMSPEQAEISGLDIDTRSDIYSLGVLLYELLTGTTPFDSKSLLDAGFAEMMRIIREVEPHKPSTRLSSLGASGARTAAQRRMGDIRRLGLVLRGDLDWIVMKCLEKDRKRRYETANSLAMDIKRHLHDELITARAPTPGYKLRKFVKRNRGLVLAGSGVAAALVLGLAGTAWQATVAAEQRDIARSESARAVAAESQATRRADELERVAEYQGRLLLQVDAAAVGVRLLEGLRSRYMAALSKANVPESQRTLLVDEFVGQLGRVNATDMAIDLIDGAILKPAVAAIDRDFVDQPAVAATLRHVLASRYHALGLDQVALSLEQQALELKRQVFGPDHPDTLDSLENVGLYFESLDRRKEAEAHYRESLQKSRQVLGDDDPDTLTCLSNLAHLLEETGQLTEAEALTREALERHRRVLGDNAVATLRALNAWGGLLVTKGMLEEAEAVHRDVLEKRRIALGDEHLDTVGAINNLATLLQRRGKFDEAITLFRAAADKRRRILGEVHPLTLSSIRNLGTVLSASGQPENAEPLLRSALEQERRLLGPDHDSALTTLGNLSVCLLTQDKFAEAEPLCRETLERRTRVLGANHSGTLIANNVMGLVLIRQQRYAEGEPYWREALKVARQTLGPGHPDTLVYTHNLAGLSLDLEKAAEAEALFREVIQAGESAVGLGHPTVLSATRRLAAILGERRQFAAAGEVLAKSEAAARASFTGSGERQLGGFLKELGAARLRLNEFPIAEANLLEAYAILVRTRGEGHKDTRSCANALLDCYMAWNKAEPGRGYDGKVAEWQKKIDALPPPVTSPATSQSARS